MKKNFRFDAARILFVIMGMLVAVLACSFRQGNSSQVSSTDSVDTYMTPSKSDPCLFLNSTSENAGDPELLERQKREIFGYPSDISLAEAVRVFNEEQKCIPGAHVGLTEDEVIAAIAAGADYGSEDVLADRRAELALIAQRRTMPKGTLFVGEGDATYSDRFLPGEVFVEGQRIYLFLGLDKTPRESQPLDRRQILLIRKKFLKTRT